MTLECLPVGLKLLQKRQGHGHGYRHTKSKTHVHVRIQYSVRNDFRHNSPSNIHTVHTLTSSIQRKTPTLNTHLYFLSSSFCVNIDASWVGIRGVCDGVDDGDGISSTRVDNDACCNNIDDSAEDDDDACCCNNIDDSAEDDDDRDVWDSR